MEKYESRLPGKAPDELPEESKKLIRQMSTLEGMNDWILHNEKYYRNKEETYIGAINQHYRITGINPKWSSYKSFEKQYSREHREKLQGIKRKKRADNF